MNNSNRSFKSWRLKQRPSGEIESTDLELVDDIIPEIRDNEILVRTIYFSLDHVAFFSIDVAAEGETCDPLQAFRRCKMPRPGIEPGTSRSSV